jgi:hypothetical protein
VRAGEAFARRVRAEDRKEMAGADRPALRDRLLGVPATNSSSPTEKLCEGPGASGTGCGVTRGSRERISRSPRTALRDSASASASVGATVTVRRIASCSGPVGWPAFAASSR